jgi:hypothetical protein
MNVMVAASEEVAELMGKKDGKEGGSERQAGEKSGGALVEESEGAKEFVERDGFILSVGGRELRACDKTCAEGEQKECDGDNEGFAGRAGKRLLLERWGRRERAPINGNGNRIDGKF